MKRRLSDSRAIRTVLVVLLLLMAMVCQADRAFSFGFKLYMVVEPPNALAKSSPLRKYDELRKLESEQKIAWLREALKNETDPITRGYWEANLGPELLATIRDSNRITDSDWQITEESYALTNAAWRKLERAATTEIRLRMLCNLVLVSAAAGYLEEAASWLKKLDQQKPDPTKAFAAHFNYLSYAANTLPKIALAGIPGLRKIVRDLPEMKDFGDKIGKLPANCLIEILIMGSELNLNQGFRVQARIKTLRDLTSKLEGGSAELFSNLFVPMLELITAVQRDDLLWTDNLLDRLPPDLRQLGLQFALLRYCQVDNPPEGLLGRIWARYRRSGPAAVGELLNAIRTAGVSSRISEEAADSFLLFADRVEKEVISQANTFAFEMDDIQQTLDLLRYPCLAIVGRFADAAKIAVEKSFPDIISRVTRRSEGTMTQEEIARFYRVDSNSSTISVSIGGLGSRATEEPGDLKVSATEALYNLTRRDLQKLAEVKVASGERRKDYWTLPASYAELAEFYLILAKEEPAKRADYLAKHLELLEKAIKIAELVGSDKELAPIYVTYAEQVTDRAKALRAAVKGLESAKKEQGKRTKTRYLLRLGRRFEELADFKRAEECCETAELVTRKLDTPSVRAIAIGRHGALMLRQPARSALGVALLKEAINLIQDERTKLGKYSKSLQQGLRDHMRSLYESLSAELIDQGRLREAQEVLALLKEDEAFGFVRGNSSVDPYERKLALLAQEAKWWRQWEALRGRAAEVLTHTDALLMKADRTSAENAQLERLRAETQIVREATSQLVAAIAAEVLGQSAKAAAASDAKLAGLSNTERLDSYLLRMANDGVSTTAVYILVTEKRLHHIIVSREGRVVQTQNVYAKDLRRLVSTFLTALRNPELDPRPAGKSLYEYVVSPVLRAIQGRSTDHIVWALDGTLRYVPLAALWDGNRYLVEQIPIAFFSPTSLETMVEGAGRNWKAAAMGTSKSAGSMSSLPAVGDELNSVVESVGGRRLLDEMFTGTAFRTVLEQRGEPVMHLATHFRLRDSVETSTILLGDGTELSLEQVRRWALGGNNLFGHLDLLYLSACSTAEPVETQDQRNDGREVDSFAAMAQLLGAKAVIATLWPVADRSTALFAREFYTRGKDGKITKDEALRRAQVALLNGAKWSGEDGPRSGSTSPPAIDRSIPRYSASSDRPYAHPFYWAPFQLFGNFK